MNINGLALILLCQLAGEIASSLSGLPVPGPVLGMALLFTILTCSTRCNEWTSSTASGLLSLLGLFYVPAGVGMMLHIDRLSGEWLPILLSLVISSTLTLIITGRLMSRFSNLASPIAGEEV